MDPDSIPEPDALLAKRSGEDTRPPNADPLLSDDYEALRRIRVLSSAGNGGGGGGGR